MTADEIEQVRAFMGAMGNAIAWAQTGLPFVDPVRLRREALGETCPTAEAKIRARFLREIQGWAAGHMIGELVTPGNALEPVREAAAEMLGQPVLTRVSDDGQSVEITSPVIDKRRL